MAETSTKNHARSGYQFGSFAGVFTPSILTIFGVIMFMRAGYVVGHAGIYHALLILTLATAVTALTGLSISAISTNTRIRGGGAYFMISRVLGPEFGGAIGLALFFAQALSVPFYILGFVEALTQSFPQLAGYFEIISFATACALFAVVAVGANWAIRVQFIILAALAIAIVTFLSGAALHFRAATFQANWNAAPGSDFWRLFAIYFPAVTGIMAGVNMSGDLREPAKAIPRGTLAAVAVGFAVYATQIFICGGSQSREQLMEQPYVTLLAQSLFGLGFLVMAGVFAATISSGIGSFMGAPRVLQALSRDHILKPLRPFETGARGTDEPRRALLLSFVITMAVLAYAGSGGGGNALNAIAVVVTMFFLMTYGIVNLAAFVESFGLNPSFRPRFKYFHWLTALAGAVGCALAAFLINAGAALVAVVIVAGLYLYIRGRTLETAFGDARRGFFYSRVRSNLLKLRTLPLHPKNWRPTVLALTGNPASRAALASFANWLGCGRGIVTLAEILVGEFEDLSNRREAELKRLESFVQTQQTGAFPEVLVAPDFDEGLTGLLQSHSIGPLKPNLVMFGWSRDPDRAEAFARHLRTARSIGMSLLILADRGLPAPGQAGRIDIWWRGQANGSLMLILAHLLTLNWAWHRARIRLLRVVRNEAGREPAAAALSELVDSARIQADVEIVVSGESFAEILTNHSSDAALVFLGFEVHPERDRPVFDESYFAMLSQIPTALLVCSNGEADLQA